MGVKERKERDREAMKARILDSAHQLFINQGYDNVSIRNIAESIEYSPATIYLYFKDKNEIFYALHMEAFKIFNDYMYQAAASKADPFEQLEQMGAQYLRFASEFPSYYKIMFMAEAPMLCDETQEGWKEGETALRNLESVVAACQAKGHFNNQSVREVSFMIWSSVHGMCSLVLSNRMKHYPVEDAPQIPAESLKIFIEALRHL